MNTNLPDAAILDAMFGTIFAGIPSKIIAERIRTLVADAENERHPDDKLANYRAAEYLCNYMTEVNG